MYRMLEDRTWLLTEGCPKAINALPILIRDEKNSEDVLKTDKSLTTSQMNCAMA